MAVNKVIYGTTVLVDLTQDTVDAAHLAKNYIAHDRSGAQVVGTMESGGGSVDVDLSADTVDAAHLAAGYTAHDCHGAQIEGVAGDWPEVLYDFDCVSAKTTAASATGMSVTCAKSGNYDITICGKSSSSSARTVSSYLYIYINGVQYGAEFNTKNGQAESYTFENVPLSAGDVVTVWLKSGNSRMSAYCLYLLAEGVQ